LEVHPFFVELFINSDMENFRLFSEELCVF